jgi:hypothetical protein
MPSGTIIWTGTDAIYFVPGDLEAYRVRAESSGGPALGRADLDRAGMLTARQMQSLRDLAGPGHLIAEIRPVLLERDPHGTDP